MTVTEIPTWYSSWWSTLEFVQVSFGVGGIRLLPPDKIPQGQIGYAVTSDGQSLVGPAPGQWQQDWLVIGDETACGDPLFSVHAEPHIVYTAMHEEDSWNPKMIAPSLDSFADCLSILSRLAVGRSNPAEQEANPPSERELASYLEQISLLTANSEEALNFWAVQADIDLDSFIRS